MDVKKAISDASKVILKDGVKDVATQVIPIVATGVATIAVALIKKDK
ncbi:hypothetical protein [Mammaliicoccus sciuri]|nr:hypothetical protein [Mammaliicoccus sciuri]